MINSVFNYGSTGRICFDLAEVAKEYNYNVKVLYGRAESLDSRAIKISSDLDVYISMLQTRLFDNHGLCNKKETLRALKWIDEFKPDIIHLHNLHGYYINYEMLFNYIKQRNIPVVWTLHDCWAFTGHCSYYSLINCNKWKVQCSNCVQTKSYPASYVLDRSENNYKQKMDAFTNVHNMALVTPSKWLKGEVQESFLKNYPVKVIYNGLDLDVFKPVNSDFKKKHGLLKKKIILGVANIWSEHKGLKDFISLSKMIDETWKIVLVGVSKSQARNLPDNILSILRTNNINELVEIYSAADVFVNPSKQETMGMVTVEALACGTPVIVYNKTAVPEVVGENCGYVVETNPKDIYDKLNVIDNVDTKQCVLWAKQFDKRITYEKYMQLYKDLKRSNIE